MVGLLQPRDSVVLPVRSGPAGPRYRVAFVNTHPIQYFAPLYAHMTKRSGIDVTALYLADFSLRGALDPGFNQRVAWDLDLLEGYAFRFMGRAAARRRIGGFFSMMAPQLWPAIRLGSYDAVVVHGHNLAAHHVALAAAMASGTPAFTRGESHLDLSRSAWRTRLRTPLLRRWYRLFDGCLAIGSGNRRYYEAMDVPASRIYSMPYVVDNERFIATADKARMSRAETRLRLGIDDDRPAILYAAKFDPRKRPFDLIEAFQMLKQAGLAAHLVMVGAGALAAELKATVAERHIENVVFPGFVNQTDLPEIYSACDVFVLPSENEPWGLVVNEAMCAGLPVVVSSDVGCAEDLVENGINGFVVDVGDVDGMADALAVLVKDPDIRARCGAASLRRIRLWGFDECARGLRCAIEDTYARRRLAAWQISGRH